VRIYTIGVGAERMAVNTAFGARVINPSEGLDEATLSQIADTTGGQYFRATNVAGLAGIYAAIDRIEPVANDPQFLRPTVALFFWPLGAALALAALLALTLLPRRLSTILRKDATT